MSVGARRSWVGSLSSAGGGSSMGGHRYWGQVLLSVGGASLSAGGALPSVGGACPLLWFEHHGQHSRGWWAWCWGSHSVGVRMGGGVSHGCGGSHRSGWWAVIVVCGRGIVVVGGGTLCMGLSAASLCFVGRGLWCC